MPMRPLLSSWPQCATRNTTQRGSAHLCPPPFPTVSQRRWLTRNHARHIKEAEEDWETRMQDIALGRKQSMLSLLEERGYVNQIIGCAYRFLGSQAQFPLTLPCSTRGDLDSLLTQRRCGVYAGVDPTAPSLHVGHMVPFMALGWMYIHGYASTFLVSSLPPIGLPSSF